MLKLTLAPTHRHFVSLGDAQSRSAGDYPGTATLFYNWLLTIDPAYRMIPLATDGATAATLRYVQLPRLREMDTAPDVVTVTLGASDFSRLAFATDTVLRDLLAHGAATLAAIRTLSPNAIIVLATLYDPMDTTDAALSVGVARFNETLRELTKAHGAIITETGAAFAGHGASVGDPLSPPDVAAPELYLCAGADLVPVPNERGAAVYADALFAAYRTFVTDAAPEASFVFTDGSPL